MPYSKKGTAEMLHELPGKKWVGLRKIYNDGCFPFLWSVDESTQQSRQVTPFGCKPRGGAQWPSGFKAALYQALVKEAR